MIQVIYYIFTFIAGTFFGSFLNVVADRSVTGESILLGRSHCDHCKKPLGPKNLIPLISYIVQRGKCEKCKKKLSLYYPVSEILTGAAFVLAAYLSGVFISMQVITLVSFAYVTFILSIYVILFLTDIKYTEIPFRIASVGIVVTLLFLVGYSLFDLLMTYYQLNNDALGVFLLQSGYLTDRINIAVNEFVRIFVSALGISIFFAILHFATPYIFNGRTGMGGGDIYLGFLIGLVNRFPISIFLIIFKIKTLKDAVPFGPFLIIGSVIALLYGNQIFNWYVGVLGY
jgi:leader peptidase (prepilin peptidase)/N-methyltransferase